MKPEVNNKKPFLIRADNNLEKWGIFTTKKQTCGRTLQRTNSNGLTQTVHINSFVDNGKQYTLTTSECKLMYVLYSLWHNAGCTLDKPVLFNFRQLVDELGLKWSGKTQKLVKRWLLNLRGVMIKFENCYKTSKEGGPIRMTEMITILDHLKIFERKEGGTYFAFSEFQFHPYILQSLHNNFVKPVRLDVVCRLKSDIAVILYRWLDLMLFRQTMIKRGLGKLAKELGLEHIRSNNFLVQVKDASEELEGKELVTGMIESCKVERLKDNSDWKLVVKKSKQVNAQLPLPDDYRQEIENEERCRKYFETLSPEVQKQIKARIDHEAETDIGYIAASTGIRKFWKEGKLVQLISQMMIDNPDTS